MRLTKVSALEHNRTSVRCLNPVFREERDGNRVRERGGGRRAIRRSAA